MVISNCLRSGHCVDFNWTCNGDTQQSQKQVSVKAIFMPPNRPTDWVVCVLTHCRYKSTNSYKLAKVVLTSFPKLLPINLAPSQQTNRLDRLLYNIPYKRVYPLLFQYYPEFMGWNIKAKGWKLCIAFESICKSYVRKILNCKIL